MRAAKVIAILLGVSGLVFGQLGSNSITITASRQLAVQPDQIVFAITVTSSQNTSLDQILAAVQPAGLTAANFSGVMISSTTSSARSAQQVLQWGFTLAVPFAQMKATVTTLTSLCQTIGQNNPGLTLSFSIAGAQASQQAQQAQQCSTAGLMADAQAQANRLASAAGYSVGSALAVSDGCTAPASNGVIYAIIGTLSSFLQSYTQPAPCSLTVKFQLLRY